MFTSSYIDPFNVEVFGMAAGILIVVGEPIVDLAVEEKDIDSQFKNRFELQFQIVRIREKRIEQNEHYCSL